MHPQPCNHINLTLHPWVVEKVMRYIGILEKSFCKHVGATFTLSATLPERTWWQKTGTHRGAFPLKLHWGFLTVIEWGVVWREQRVFKQNFLLHVFVSQFQKSLKTLGILDSLISAQNRGVDWVSSRWVISFLIRSKWCFSFIKHLHLCVLNKRNFPFMFLVPHLASVCLRLFQLIKWKKETLGSFPFLQNQSINLQNSSKKLPVSSLIPMTTFSSFICWKIKSQLMDSQ